MGRSGTERVTVPVSRAGLARTHNDTAIFVPLTLRNSFPREGNPWFIAWANVPRQPLIQDGISGNAISESLRWRSRTKPTSSSTLTGSSM